MSPALTALLLVGLLTVSALGGYAWWLWRRVWRQQRQQGAAARERQERLAEDLRILAGSLLAEQVSLIEGAIRIKVLADNYDPALSNDPRFSVFQRLYDETSQVPTHGAWKALPREERRRHETHFSELELQYKAAARKASRWLLDEVLGKHVAPLASPDGAH